jgi:DNA-binding response OmpR family regulator
VLQNGVSMQGLVYLQKPFSLKQLARAVQALMTTAIRT